MSVEERTLIDRCRRGDAQAWDELFERHYDAVGRFVFQISPDFTREDVDEICQEVFLTVVRNLAGFRGASALQTWLFRIAVNKARDSLEKRRAAKRGGGRAPVPLDREDPETGRAIDPPAKELSPDQALLNREQMLLLRAALDRLTDPCREIIELRYFGDLSYEELSTALDLNPKTVSSRLSKCLDRLEIIAQEVFAGENPARSPV
jgi:RNA polymerase sigma-70 factor (ECF subfamily)